MPGNKKKRKRQPSAESFRMFIKARDQKRALLVLLLLYAVIFAILKITYPYPITNPDTGNYVLSAKTLTFGGYRPIGYSWFIHLFHLISPGINAQFAGQFIFNLISQLFFLFTVQYFFRLKKAFFYSLAALTILSPSVLYCTNYLMSDSIFNSLTLLLLATSIWILARPNLFILLLHFIVLYLAINVRYIGFFYTLLSAAILLYNVRRRKLYWALAAIPIIIGIKTYLDTRAANVKQFKVETFSGFSGWALANNAVAVLPYVDLPLAEIEDQELKYIHSICTRYHDSIYRYEYIEGTHFIWEKSYPGKQYLFQNIRSRNLSYVKAWVFSGERLGQYGSLLIKRYPWQYFRHYLLPNSLRTFYTYQIPDADIFENTDLMRRYFNLDWDEYEYEYKLFGPLFIPRQVASALLWALFIASVVLFFAYHKKTGFTQHQKTAVLFLLIFILIYVVMSIISHPINNFRYLIPVYAIRVFIPVLMLSKLFPVVRGSRKQGRS